MKRFGIINGLAAWLAVVGICLPQPLLAAGAANPSPAVTDVALRDGGILLGQVVDPQGTAKANAPVSLQAGSQELAVGRTDTNGYFAFSGLRGGVYQVSTGAGEGIFRVWTANTAPPSAQQGALLVDGKEVVRGGHHGEHLKFWLSNPWVIAGVVAAAVAIPVAIHNSQSHPHSP